MEEAAKHYSISSNQHSFVLTGTSWSGNQYAKPQKNTGFYMGDTNYWKRVKITIGHNVENFQSREKKEYKVKLFYKSHKMETIVK